MRRNIGVGISIIVVVGLAVWASLEHQRKVRLLREHQVLEQKLEEMASLMNTDKETSERLARAKPTQSLTDEQQHELLRLRGQKCVLRQQASKLESVRDENRQAHADFETAVKTGAKPKPIATADYWPQESWAFQGYETADAALQSSLWAANNGDLKALLKSATGELQEMIAADLSGKSETEASVRAMDEVLGMKAVRVLNREAQGNDAIVLTTQIEGRADTQTQKLLLKKVGKEWKVAGRAP